MELEQVLNRAVDRIRSGQLNNEDQVKLSVILPILRALEWDDTNPSELVPEFSIPSGRVDYALFDAARGPLVFVEAKRLGNADESGIEQVFGYAANRGVPFLVLTDGNVWDFYLSMAEGVPEGRRFYRIELQRDDKIADYASFFEKYLHKGRVALSETRLEAEQLRDGDRQKEAARAAIPGVWRALLTTPDESLCSLIADAVEEECGTQPELDDVEAFLNEVLSASVPSVQSAHAPPTPTVTRQEQSPSVVPSLPTNSGKIIGFILDGERMDTGVGNRTLAEVIKAFHRRDPGFMGRFAARTRGRTRRLVAQTRDELYDLAHLRDYAIDLGNGWWLGTNLGTGSIRKNIGIACGVMGVQLGSQLTLIEM